MRPVKEELKDPSWNDVINKAHLLNLNLIASDGCKTGEMDPYTVCSLGLTEVEVDILTGNYLVKRVDILQDAGESLNPNVDIGQVEGAFIMGLGYWTTELCVTDKTTGELKTNRSWNYKPPGAKDIPTDFRIELFAQSPNQAGFMRSKGNNVLIFMENSHATDFLFQLLVNLLFVCQLMWLSLYNRPFNQLVTMLV